MIQLIITGNIGQDPIFKGEKLFFTVASTEKSGTQWVNCFLKFSEGSKVPELIKKGGKIFVQGYVFQTFYEKEGQKIPSLSINVTYFEV